MENEKSNINLEKNNQENNDSNYQYAREEQNSNYKGDKQYEYQNSSKSSSSFSKCLGRAVRYLCDIIEKGNNNYLEFAREDSKPFRLPITIFIILLLAFFPPVSLLLVLGLFFGYKYSFVGPDINGERVNNFMDKASNGAQNMKNDFCDGYSKK